MKTIKITIYCMLFASAAFFVSCKKSQNAATNPATDTDVSTASDNALGEHISNDVISIAAEASDLSGSGSMDNYRMPNDLNFLTGCASVAKDTAAKTITITFNGYCQHDMKYRTGQIIIDYSVAFANHARWYRVPGFGLTITSNNYTVDSNQVFIHKTILNTTSPNFNPATTNETWHIVAQDTINKNGGGTFTWNCDRIKTLLNTNDPTVYRGDTIGSLHIVWSKAIIGFTGNAYGVAANGDAYTVNVTEQLVRDFMNCHPWNTYRNGKIDFTPGSKATRHIDFGYSPQSYGDCDNWVEIIVGNNTYHRLIR